MLSFLFLNMTKILTLCFNSEADLDCIEINILCKFYKDITKIAASIMLISNMF